MLASTFGSGLKTERIHYFSPITTLRKCRGRLLWICRVVTERGQYIWLLTSLKRLNQYAWFWRTSTPVCSEHTYWQTTLYSSTL